jgi:heme exporter protein C
MWWKILVLAGMSGIIVASFVTPPPQPAIGEASRIFYYHVPVAWVSVLAFAMAMGYSIAYLRTRELKFDDRAHEAARLGITFCLMATISGSIFAKVSWGSFWNWDPRETSIFLLLLIYGAYFSLRAALPEERRRAALSAVYAILAFVSVPFLVFVVPRMYPSLHPSDAVVDQGVAISMSSTVAMIFFPSLALFTVLYFWMFNLAARTRTLVRSQQEIT